jgi:hypothetical protein
MGDEATARIGVEEEFHLVKRIRHLLEVDQRSA